MQSAVRIETQILPGNRIEVELPMNAARNSVGQTIEVILLLPEQTVSNEKSILEVLTDIHTKHFSSSNANAVDTSQELKAG
ncbi:MAG: hypothetical protein ACFBSC_13725 [Microcoleaceae cyanobacterium]